MSEPELQPAARPPTVGWLARVFAERESGREANASSVCTGLRFPGFQLSTRLTFVGYGI